MAKTAMKKETTALPCAHCLEAPKVIAISGETATGKNDRLIKFHVCQPCYGKMCSTYGEATKIANLRKRFWERVRTNAKKLAANDSQ